MTRPNRLIQSSFGLTVCWIDHDTVYHVFLANRYDIDLFGQVSALVNEKGWAVAQLEKDRGRLEDVFRAITTREQEVAHG